MSLRADALSARNVIILAVVVLIIALVWAVASALGPNDSGGVARDSYGTQAHGYRALFELLGELSAPPRRSTSPPGPGMPVDGTFVLLAPHTQLVVTAPKHLHAVRDWVEAGGRLIVAPSVRESEWAKRVREMQTEDLKGAPADVLDALDVDDFIALDERAGFRVDSPLNPNADDDDQPHWTEGENYDFLPDEVKDALKKGPPKADLWPVEVAGSFASMAADVDRLALPAEGFAAIEADRNDLAGALIVKVDDETQFILAASISVGKGEVIVIAEPLMLANFYLPQADNSVLAARLLADGVSEVVFDEFYHGLAVRGNPFYLLTHPAFATIVLVVLAGVVAWAWRGATFLGPPLATGDPTRRTIAEYVDAMARFFSRGDGSRRFLVEEIREGVLRELCRRLQLPLETTDPERIAAKLAQRDPHRAEQLAKALHDIDARRAGGRDYSRTHFLPDMQRLTACL
jgi:hypothetical protein